MLKNLTPHSLVLRANGEDTVLAPDPEGPARVASVPGTLEDVPGIPVPVATKDAAGTVDGLPAPKAGVWLIVSAVVGAACTGRADVLVPGTGPADSPVREDGRIVAVTRLKRV